MAAHLTRRRLWPALLGAVLAAALVAPVAQAGTSPASGVKSYAASTTSATVQQGASVGLRLLDCGACGGARASNQPFGSAQVSFPSGVFVWTPTSADHGWLTRDVSTTPGTTTLQLTTSTGTSVAPGDMLTLTLTALTNAPTGPATLTTRVKQSNDFSGTGNDFANSGSDPSVTVVPRLVVTWTQGPSSVQQTGSTATASGVSPQYVMCPAPAATVTSGDGTPQPGVVVTLTALQSDGSTAYTGLRQDGTASSAAITATTDTSGAATFGSCAASPPSGLRATDLATGLSLTATAGSASATAGSFDVQQVYGPCTGACSSSLTGPAKTQAQVSTSSATTADAFTFTSAGAATWAAFTAACDPDPGAAGTNPYRDVVTVDVAARSKTATLTWTKTAVQWATNNGASQWRVCAALASPHDAPTPFATVPGTGGQVGDFWVGALLVCGDPALGGTDPCLAKLNKTGAGQQQAVVQLPLRPGDPKMY